jgi:hypothetical protein
MDFNNSNKACASWGQGDVCAAGGTDRVVHDTPTDCVVYVQWLGMARGCGRIQHVCDGCHQFAHSGIHSPHCDSWYRRGESFLGRVATYGGSSLQFRTTTGHSTHRGRRRSALGALANPSSELFDVIEDLTTLGHLGQDFLLGVHHRGVVATECLPDLGQG